MSPVAALLLGWLSCGQMLDPADNRGPRFEYFTATTCRLLPFPAGPLPESLDLRRGFRLTAFGELACRRGRLIPLAFDPVQPLAARVKGWVQGWAPPAGYEVTTPTASYLVQVLATPVDGMPGDVGLLRIIVAAGAEATEVTVGVGFIADAGYGVAWPEHDPDAEYTMEAEHAERRGRVLYTWPANVARVGRATVDQAYTGPFTPRQVYGLAETPVAVSLYRLALTPRQRVSLVFRVPEQEVSPALALAALRRVDFDEAMYRQARQQVAWLQGQWPLEVPEAKVTEAYRVALLTGKQLTGASPRPGRALSPTEASRLVAAETIRQMVAVDSPAGPVLSPALTLRRARLALAADRPAEALALLYGALLHTNACHLFPDAVPARWSVREPVSRWAEDAALAPAGELVVLLREGLVRVRSDEVELLGLLSPAWMRPGQRVALANAPTPHGRLDLELLTDATGATIGLGGSLSAAAKLKLRLPWFVPVSQVLVNGEPVTASGAWVPLPAAVRQVRLVFDPADVAAAPSYAATVEAYRSEYAELAAAHQAAGGELVRFSPPELWSLERRRARFEQRHGSALVP